MSHAQAERHGLCQELLEVGPGAPTLCEGWESQDLAAHLWVRETDPLAAPGMFIRPLAPVTDRRMGELLDKWDYATLVARIDAGPSHWSLFALPGVDEMANLMEYFVHHEDVRRANGRTSSRELGDELEDLFWRRLALAGRAFFRSVPVGVELEDSRSGERIRVSSGTDTVTLVGLPSELVLYAFGRGAAAHVEAVGTDEGLAALEQAGLGI